MTLSRQEMLELRAADGLAEAGELDELRDAGIDIEEMQALRKDLALALRPSVTPDLADDVMEALGLGDETPVIRASLRAAVLPTRSPDLADAVLATLAIGEGTSLSGALRDALAVPAGVEIDDEVLAAAGVADDWSTLRGALRASLTAPGEPDLADAVMSTLGAAEEAPRTAELLRHALSPAQAPDIADAVMDRLGLGDPTVIPLSVPAAPTRRVASRQAPRNWGFAVISAAAAAAMLMLFMRPMAVPSGAPFAFDMASVNQVEIEELSTDADAMVQVLQFDEGAPTIIFIEDLSSGDEGATL